MLSENLILLTDSYKVSHWKQYPPNTQTIYSYFESRGGLFPNVVFFGLQYFLKRYLEGVVITHEKIDEAKKIFEQHFGSSNLFNEGGWRIIVNEYGGKLPVRIKAVPEGTVVNISNVLMTIENLDSRLYWLTNYLETLLVQVWYPTTVATLSYHMKRMITHYARITGDPSLVNFKLHDFGFRGVSSVESAMIGGLAHLLNFMGTDTMASIICAQKYYNTSSMPGFSIPAAEHSTITSWGKDHELDAFENMLKQYPEGLVAVVSDSYDIYTACKHYWGGLLKDQVLARNGCLVVRPDSGNPPEVVVKVLNILGDRFGYTTNDKGFKVLDSHIRVIQGDGIDYDMCDKILEAMMIAGWSTDNVAFGMGGALLQKLNRDTQRFAFKCSAIQRDNEWQDVFKSPVTDSGKRSKMGRLKLIRVDGETFTTVPENVSTTQDDLLQTVFEHGEVLKEYTFEECKSNLK